MLYTLTIQLIIIECKRSIKKIYLKEARMKTFLKTLAGMAILFVTIGCPNDNSNGGGGTTVPITSITLTYNGRTLSSTDRITLNAGEVTAAINTVSDPPGATFGWFSNNNNFVIVTNGVLSGVAAGSTEIRCIANNEQGGIKELIFPVTVLPKLTSFEIKYGNDTVDTCNASYPFELDIDENEVLTISVTPPSAENKFTWSAEPSAGITIDTSVTGQAILKAAANGDFAITVTPDQAGLGSAVPAKTFYVRFTAIIPEPVMLSVLSGKK